MYVIKLKLNMHKPNKYVSCTKPVMLKIRNIKTTTLFFFTRRTLLFKKNHFGEIHSVNS